MIATQINYGQLAIACGGLMLAMIAAFFGVTLLRRRLRDEPTALITTFTLDDLRQMHQQGQLTEQEYERAKQKIISQVPGETSTKGATKAGGGENLADDDGRLSS